MNILLLGDIMGPSGRKAIHEKLPEIIKKKKIDFVIVNGENSGDMGVGITKKYFNEFLAAGADVVTTGNHVWDEKEAIEFISKIEEVCGVSVDIISTGPERESTIFKNDII